MVSKVVATASKQASGFSEQLVQRIINPSLVALIHQHIVVSQQVFCLIELLRLYRLDDRALALLREKVIPRNHQIFAFLDEIWMGTDILICACLSAKALIDRLEIVALS